MRLEHENIPSNIVRKFLDIAEDYIITNNDDNILMIEPLDNIFHADFILVDKDVFKKKFIKKHNIDYIIVIIDIDFATYFLTYNPTTKEFDNILEDETLYDQLYVMGTQDFLFTRSARYYPNIPTKDWVLMKRKSLEIFKKLNENCILRFKEFIK